MRRTSRILVALAVVVLGLSAAPASADDIPPPLLPPGVTAPPGGDSDVPPGPTYEITPGVGGDELPEPSDPDEAAENAKNAEDAAKTDESEKPGTEPGAGPGSGVPGSPVPSPTVPPGESAVQGSPAVPVAIGEPPRVAGASDDQRWWMVGAGALLLISLGELFWIRLRRGALPEA